MIPGLQVTESEVLTASQRLDEMREAERVAAEAEQQRSEAKAALDRAKALGELKAALERARFLGLPEADCAPAAARAKVLEEEEKRVKEAEERRRAAAAALERALAAATVNESARNLAEALGERPLEALDRALREAREAGVANAEIERAELRRKELEQRAKAQAAAAKALQEAQNELEAAKTARDIETLRHAIRDATEAAVPDTELNVAKTLLTNLTEERNRRILEKQREAKRRAQATERLEQSIKARDITRLKADIEHGVSLDIDKKLLATAEATLRAAEEEAEQERLAEERRDVAKSALRAAVEGRELEPVPSGVCFRCATGIPQCSNITIIISSLEFRTFGLLLRVPDYSNRRGRLPMLSETREGGRVLNLRSTRCGNVSALFSTFIYCLSEFKLRYVPILENSLLLLHLNEYCCLAHILV